MFEVWRSAGMACLAMPIHFGPCPWALHQFLSSTMHMVSLGPSVLLCSTETINQLKATLGDNISWFEVFKRPGQINTHQDSNRELAYLTQFFPAWRATLHLLFISGHQEMPMSWYAISQSLILLTRSFATRQAVKWRTPRIFYQPGFRLFCPLDTLLFSKCEGTWKLVFALGPCKEASPCPHGGQSSGDKAATDLSVAGSIPQSLVCCKNCSYPANLMALPTIAGCWT